MDRISINTSSDEDDDPYTNSVARLRALKKRRLESDQFCDKKEKLSPIKNEQQINVININSFTTTNSTLDKSSTTQISTLETNGKENDNELSVEGIQTRSMTVRGRRGRNKSRDKDRNVNRKATMRRKKPQLPIDDLECDVEIVSSEEKPTSILDSCKTDTIILLDDDEDDNYEINIKVCWRSCRIDRLSMRRHDSFQGIFQYYADFEKVPVDEILIMKKDKVVNPTDTPATLKLSIIDILDGGIVNPGLKALTNDKDDDNTCSIKVQTANKKQSLIIPLKRDQRFATLFASCAEQLDMEESSLKFYFDGEQISPSDTPESLDLEGEACIDLHIST